MDSNQFMGALVVALISLIGLIVAIVTPIVKLNSNIVKLNSNIEHMRENDKVRDHRITKHGEEIQEVQHELANHEGRIKSLENWRQTM